MLGNLARESPFIGAKSEYRAVHRACIGRDGRSRVAFVNDS